VVADYFCHNTYAVHVLDLKFDKYRIIRMSEAPKAIDVHFVKNEIAPTGMGEPPFPPIFGALANALYKATGKRVYHQPFLGEKAVLG
jgi:isoquinoline 1-oxidoreductase beta subunit